MGLRTFIFEFDSVRSCVKDVTSFFLGLGGVAHGTELGELTDPMPRDQVLGTQIPNFFIFATARLTRESNQGLDGLQSTDGSSGCPLRDM